MLWNKGAKLSPGVLNTARAQGMARAHAAAAAVRSWEQMALHNSPLNLSSSVQKFPRGGGEEEGNMGEKKNANKN